MYDALLEEEVTLINNLAVKVEVAGQVVEVAHVHLDSHLFLQFGIELTGLLGLADDLINIHTVVALDRSNYVVLLLAPNRTVDGGFNGAGSFYEGITGEGYVLECINRYTAYRLGIGN